MPRSHLAVALCHRPSSSCVPRYHAPRSRFASTSPPNGATPKTWPRSSDVLETWLDRQSDWPRRDEAPRVRLVSEWQAKGAAGRRCKLPAWASARALRSGPVRDPVGPGRGPGDASDVSVLLHELVITGSNRSTGIARPRRSCRLTVSKTAG